MLIVILCGMDAVGTRRGTSLRCMAYNGIQKSLAGRRVLFSVPQGIKI